MALSPRSLQLIGPLRRALGLVTRVIHKDSPEISEAELVPHLKTLCDGTSLTPQDFYPYAYELLIARQKGPKLTTLRLVCLNSEVPGDLRDRIH